MQLLIRIQLDRIVLKGFRPQIASPSKITTSMMSDPVTERPLKLLAAALTTAGCV
jgi:hypothetical protein